MKTSKMNKAGVSVCATGQENYERFKARRGKWFYQYDYRHTDGELFSIVLPTLDKCRQKRNEWVAYKKLKASKRQAVIQGDRAVLISEDGISIPMIFNNLTGKNSKTAEDYCNYVQNVAFLKWVLSTEKSNY